jgi:spore coat polysaccharide biosynthesis protein SpsF
MEVMGRPLLSYQLERLRRSRRVDEIVVATSIQPQDAVIEEFCRKEPVSVFRGSEEDVLDRFLQTARAFKGDVIVRSTADCPLIDPSIVDLAVERFLERNPPYDYVSNILERTYPRGMDVEVFSSRLLEEAARNARDPAEREHVTPYMYLHPEKYALGSIVRQPDESHYRWTVDTPEDFQLISTVLKAIYPANPTFTLEDLLQAFKEHPDWIKINAHIQQKK